MPHLPDTSEILSLNSPGTTITFIGTPTIPGMLIFSRKDQEYGAEGTGVPRSASKTPAGPRQIVEIATSTPKIPRIAPEKAPKQTQDLVLKFP